MTISQPLAERFQQQLPDLNRSHPDYVSRLVDAIVAEAQSEGASDVHLLPGDDGLHMTWRIDGVLQHVACFPRELSSNIVSRLKVLAELLTYQTDVPQEGRIRTENGGVEMRVSTFPTLYGEKGVIRLFVGSGKFRTIDELSLPTEVSSTLKHLLEETGGIILITGPAGSGKTTTCYACLRELVDRESEEKSIVTLEDPIEAMLPGVAQSQMKPVAGFDYKTGLRSVLRQDPEVIMVGEIRDSTTAKIVFQASMTGHLVLTTFHAGSAAESITRLLDMGIEPYQLRSGILCVLNLRLLRKLCRCSKSVDADAKKLGLDVQKAWEPVGCAECGGTGYRGRMVIAEILLPNVEETGRAILSLSDAPKIEQLAIEAGMVDRWRRVKDAVNTGQTSPAEARRVLGFRN